MTEIVFAYVENTVGSFFCFEKMLDFLDNSGNLSLKASWHALVHVLQPIFVFHAGVRKNNLEYVNTGVKLRIKVFKAAWSRKYVRIYYHFLAQHKDFPAAVVGFLNEHISTVRPGENRSVQGLDIFLEEMNKVSKISSVPLRPKKIGSQSTEI